jgi:hypothetical protein
MAAKMGSMKGEKSAAGMEAMLVHLLVLEWLLLLEQGWDMLREVGKVEALAVILAFSSLQLERERVLVLD